MMKTVLKSAVVAGTLVIMAGCASNAGVDKIEQANRKAEAAQSTANDAKQTANQALQTAREAQQTSQANSQRIERMFKASQRK
ncbi:MAG TPA: Lpp/OprI family alanine-zipper lipoprotein [Salinisphaeraceae bacterium]|nr:Lpp/OprI family alanine-zipper lipoprotein [Salinisphaeraceae bacterium]